MSSAQYSGRRKSSVDKDKLAKLQQLKIFQQTGGVASKLLKIKASANEAICRAMLEFNRSLLARSGTKQNGIASCCGYVI